MQRQDCSSRPTNATTNTNTRNMATSGILIKRATIMADTYKQYILALDQGTTSSRAIVFGHNGRIVARSSQEFKQIYPRPGWVEHNPEDIWSSQINVAIKVMQDANLHASDFAAIGIANQRETTVVWDKAT